MSKIIPYLLLMVVHALLSDIPQCEIHARYCSAHQIPTKKRKM